jgi:uncharacterized membrane protein YsdA (DUF1294 family)
MRRLFWSARGLTPLWIRRFCWYEAKKRSSLGITLSSIAHFRNRPFLRYRTELLKRAKQSAIEIPTLTAPVVEWNYDRGFGFLQHGSQRIFLHIRDLAHRRRVPRVGDIMRFKLGLDAQGRTCAVEAIRHTDGPRFPLGALILLPLLLAFPFLALKRFAPDPKLLYGYFAGISTLTWLAYHLDKDRAKTGGWRIPEAHLHLLELLGGWPAAFLAQRCLRHKISKRSYQTVFCLILLLHQYAALDFLLHGKMTRTIVHATVQFAEEYIIAGK